MKYFNLKYCSQKQSLTVTAKRTPSHRHDIYERTHSRVNHKVFVFHSKYHDQTPMPPDSINAAVLPPVDTRINNSTRKIALWDRYRSDD